MLIIFAFLSVLKHYSVLKWLKVAERGEIKLIFNE